MNSDSQPTNPPSLLTIGTLVGWLVCLAISVLGLILSYPGPRVPMDQKEHLPAQIIDSQFTPQPAPPVAAPLPPPAQSPPSPEPPSPDPAPSALPPEPQLTAVAPPSPFISFALPTEGLTRIVDASQAAYIRSTTVASPTTGTGRSVGPSAPAPPPPKPVDAPAIAKLIFGEGEGRQPPPEYPRDAALAREEGTVGLRFTVGEDGRVTSVEIVSPSRWPRLNQAASRAIRDTWRFNPGPRRIYEVPIEFQLNH